MLCIANSTYVETADRPSSSPEAWLKTVRRWPSCSQICRKRSPTPRRRHALRRRRAQPPPDPAAPRRRRGRAIAPRRAGRPRAALEGRNDEDRSYRERLDFELDVIIRMGLPATS
jgi:DNA polymerase-3 subunit alpha